MHTIFKYRLEGDTTVVPIPEGSYILTVQVQQGALCVWALVDTDAPLKLHTFRIYNTGQEIPKGRDLFYIGTCQLFGGDLVLHVFEDLTGVNNG